MDERAQSLQQALQRIIPGARLEPVSLSAGRALQLLLLNSDYPQGELDPEGMARIMDNPLYWVFCWASGLVLARRLLSSPEQVAGKRVLDFGCGSGVVAIAAKLAGAREVIACDIDAQALEATAVNAHLNRVALTLCDDFYNVDGELDLIVVADVLYDQGNFPWLQRFVQRAPQVLIADSRVKHFDFPPYREVGREPGCTLPDLDESPEFRDVRLYQAG